MCHLLHFLSSSLCMAWESNTRWSKSLHSAQMWEIQKQLVTPSWLWINSALAIAAIRRVNQQMQNFCLSFSLHNSVFQNKIDLYKMKESSPNNIKLATLLHVCSLLAYLLSSKKHDVLVKNVWSYTYTKWMCVCVYISLIYSVTLVMNIIIITK